MASEASLRVVVVFSPAAREIWEANLDMALPFSVEHAIHASGLLLAFPRLQLSELDVGVWGRQVGLTHMLRDRDRVEIYRPLTVDPKVARRERFAKQGARTAGLFMKKRAGAKAGY